jgi:NADH-quinone oxidoreductase subunit L
MFLTFYKDFRGTEEQRHHLHESPSLITFPLIVLAFLATIGGLISLPFAEYNWLNGYLAPIFTKATTEAHGLGFTEYSLMVIAIIGAFFGIFIAYRKYIQQNILPSEDAQINGFTKILYNKYYIDEAYDKLFVNTTNGLSKFFRDYVETGLSSLVFGLGKITNELSSQGRKVQNGSIGLYLFGFVLGMCAIISYLFLVN